MPRKTTVERFQLQRADSASLLVLSPATALKRDLACFLSVDLHLLVPSTQQARDRC